MSRYRTIRARYVYVDRDGDLWLGQWGRRTDSAQESYRTDVHKRRRPRGQCNDARSPSHRRQAVGRWQVRRSFPVFKGTDQNGQNTAMITTTLFFLGATNP